MKISELTEIVAFDGEEMLPIVGTFNSALTNFKTRLKSIRSWMLDSPDLTGTPTAESTPATSDNSLKLATTAFVKNVLADGGEFIQHIGKMIKSIAFGQGTVINSGADLNNYTTIGRYCCKDAQVPSTVTNRPTNDNLRFELIVEYSGPTASVKQTYNVTGETDESYTRSYYNGNWGSWSKLATMYDCSYIVKRYRYVYTGWGPGPHKIKANEFEVFNGSTWESGGISTPDGYYPAAIRQLSPGDEASSGYASGYVVPQAFSLNAEGASNAFSFFSLRGNDGSSVADYANGTVTINILYLPLSSKTEPIMSGGSITPVTPSIGG